MPFRPGRESYAHPGIFAADPPPLLSGSGAESDTGSLSSPVPRGEVHGIFSRSRLDGHNPIGCQSREAWFSPLFHPLLPSLTLLVMTLSSVVLMGTCLFQK